MTLLEMFECIVVDLTPHLKEANKEEIKAVETALKEYQAILDKTDKEIVIVDKDTYDKKLKALEIFKTKQIDILGLRISKSANEYNRIIKLFGSNITQEEFVILKEVLL